LNDGNVHIGLVIKKGEVWFFDSPEIMEGNGWPVDNAPEIKRRDIAGLDYGGRISTIDPVKYGPEKTRVSAVQ
jgi:hypothetical protein